MKNFKKCLGVMIFALVLVSTSVGTSTFTTNKSNTQGVVSKIVATDPPDGIVASAKVVNTDPPDGRIENILATDPPDGISI